MKYRAFGRLPESTAAASINPRSDGIVIGNMMERGNWSLDPNPEVRQQNVDAAIRFFAAMRARRFSLPPRKLQVKAAH